MTEPAQTGRAARPHGDTVHGQLAMRSDQRWCQVLDADARPAGHDHEVRVSVQGVEKIKWKSGTKLQIKVTGGAANQIIGPVDYVDVRLTSGPIISPPPAPPLGPESYCARFDNFKTNEFGPDVPAGKERGPN